MFAHTRALAAPRRSSGLFARVLTALSLHRQRRALVNLDDAQLRDIGLTHAQARREAARSAWDVPPGWRL